MPIRSLVASKSQFEKMSLVSFFLLTCHNFSHDLVQACQADDGGISCGKQSTAAFAFLSSNPVTLTLTYTGGQPGSLTSNNRYHCDWLRAQLEILFEQQLSASTSDSKEKKKGKLRAVLQAPTFQMYSFCQKKERKGKSPKLWSCSLDAMSFGPIPLKNAENEIINTRHVARVTLLSITPGWNQYLSVPATLQWCSNERAQFSVGVTTARSRKSQRWWDRDDLARKRLVSSGFNTGSQDHCAWNPSITLFHFFSSLFFWKCGNDLCCVVLLMAARLEFEWGGLVQDIHSLLSQYSELFLFAVFVVFDFFFEHMTTSSCLYFMQPSAADGNRSKYSDNADLRSSRARYPIRWGEPEIDICESNSWYRLRYLIYRQWSNRQRQAPPSSLTWTEATVWKSPIVGIEPATFRFKSAAPQDPTQGLEHSDKYMRQESDFEKYFIFYSSPLSLLCASN